MAAKVVQTERKTKRKQFFLLFFRGAAYLRAVAQSRANREKNQKKTIFSFQIILLLSFVISDFLCNFATNNH